MRHNRVDSSQFTVDSSSPTVDSSQSTVDSSHYRVDSSQFTVDSSRSTANSHGPVVIVGGGIAGLVAAIRVAKAGVPALVLEKSSSVGGRAATHEKHGFLFNLGPHALYRNGALRQTLDEFGVEIHGALPPTNGGVVFRGGRRLLLPVGWQ